MARAGDIANPQRLQRVRAEAPALGNHSGTAAHTHARADASDDEGTGTDSASSDRRSQLRRLISPLGRYDAATTSNRMRGGRPT